jgi:hypothetical protein
VNPRTSPRRLPSHPAGWNPLLLPPSFAQGGFKRFDDRGVHPEPISPPGATAELSDVSPRGPAAGIAFPTDPLRQYARWQIPHRISPGANPSFDRLPGDPLLAVTAQVDRPDRQRQPGPRLPHPDAASAPDLTNVAKR